MLVYNVPTALFRIFNKEDYKEAVSYINSIGYPVVIKANGIAAGKGVVIAYNRSDAEEAIDNCFLKDLFGDAGNTVVIEEFMEGKEVSIFAFSDGVYYLLLPPAQDHKRIADGDMGKNTGGMGAYAPVPFIGKEETAEIENEIIKPVLKAMRELGCPFIGCLYAGLMMTEEGPKVVEFNCRFGDPETQVILPLMQGDFTELLYSAAKGRIQKELLFYNGGSSVSVVAASGGYPDKYEKGFEITGLDNQSEKVIINHAGTKEKDGKIITDGGRVLNVTSVLKNNDLIEAKKIAYTALSKIFFEKIYFRKDISDKAWQ